MLLGSPVVARTDLTVSCVSHSGNPSLGKPSTTSSLCVEGARVFRGPESNPSAPGDVNLHVRRDGQGYVRWVIAQVGALTGGSRQCSRYLQLCLRSCGWCFSYQSFLLILHLSRSLTGSLGSSMPVYLDYDIMNQQTQELPGTEFGKIFWFLSFFNNI